MKKALLTGISDILPFDDTYLKVGAGRGSRWNLMTADGKLVSDTWFSAVSRNSDGSVNVLPATRGAVEVKFPSVVSIARAADAFRSIPAIALRQLDPTSVRLDPHGRFVARAKLYGQDVDVAASGDIYLPGGEKVRALVGEVDGRRLGEAVWSVNRKLHRDSKPQDLSKGYSTYKTSFERKQTLWAFWFATDKHSVCTDYGTNLTMALSHVAKWTSRIVLRLMPEFNGTRLVSPEDVRRLQTILGARGDEGAVNVAKTITWQIDEGDVSRVVEALRSF